MKETILAEQLVPYLPYSLKCMFSTSDIYTLIGIVKEDLYLQELRYPADLYLCKPILRPMSDLFFKKVTEQGVENYYMNWLHNEQLYGVEYPVNFNEIDKIQRYNDLLNRLFGWHFDVFGLIPAGLAVDINSLNEKP